MRQLNNTFLNSIKSKTINLKKQNPPAVTPLHVIIHIFNFKD